MKETKEQGCPVPKGILLIIGGKENKGQAEKTTNEEHNEQGDLEILKKMIELSEKDDPVLEIVTTASSEGDESFEEYRKLFEDLKVSRINHLHHENRNIVLKEDLTDRIDEADIVFFTGGDQLKLTSIYGGTTFLQRLKERYINSPIVIAGTSAGAMALSTPMIYAGSSDKQQLGGQIKVTTGLEFLKDVCIDTHFVNRGRFVRLSQVIATNPGCIGMGIEEDTSVMVRDGREMEVVGSGTIIIIEGDEICDMSIEEFNDEKPVTIRDIKTHILGPGKKYHLRLINPQHL